MYHDDRPGWRDVLIASAASFSTVMMLGLLFSWVVSR